MIKIINRKLNVEISIDEEKDWIKFNPRHYEDNPYVEIEMNGFDFLLHSNKCPDCKLFLNSFGQDSTDWYISYSEGTFRLDTKQLGSKDYTQNKIKFGIDDCNNGTRMTLKFLELTTNKIELQELLNLHVIKENYEYACVIRDLINEKTFSY